MAETKNIPDIVRLMAEQQNITRALELFPAAVTAGADPLAIDVRHAAMASASRPCAARAHPSRNNLPAHRVSVLDQ